MLALLVGCTCPSFDEMEVVARDETATDEIVESARDALTTFAAWTGDEGVCVPSIELRYDLAEPRGLEDEVQVGGQYAGPRRPIGVATEWPDEVAMFTRHELCHAMDHQEGHSGEIAWPEVDHAELYDADSLPRENFAEACDDGPYDLGYDTALVARCGDESTFTDADRYLAEVVFPHAPYATFTGEPIPLTVTTRAWSGIADDADVLDVAPYEDGVALLLVEPSPSGPTLVVRTFDAALAEERGAVVLATGGEADTAWFTPSDEGLYVRQGSSWGRWGTRRVDPKGGRRAGVDEMAEHAAISDGVYYYRDEWDGSFRGMTLAGEYAWTWQPPELAQFVGMFPAPGGYGVLDLQALHVWSRATGEWTTARFPYPMAATQWADLGGGRIVVVSGSRALLWDGAGWTFLGDPCGDVDDTWYFDEVVPAGDHLVGVPRGVGPRTITELRWP